MTPDEPIEAVVARANDRDVYVAADAAQRLVREVERLSQRVDDQEFAIAAFVAQRDEARADNAALQLRVDALTNWEIEMQAERNTLLARIERLQVVARGTKGLDATYREWAGDDEESFTVLPDRLDADWAIVGDALAALQPGDLWG